MGITGNVYRYTSDLLALESHHPGLHWRPPFARAPSPIVISALRPALQLHPDQRFAAYIRQGLQTGFRIGFDRGCPLAPTQRNHPSAVQHPEVVHDHLQVEVARGSLVGPLAPSLAALVHTSPIGLVPKPHSDRWRLIVDLSSPDGASVNDGIDPDLCSLMYASVDNAVTVIQQLGQGTRLVKMDLKDAYRVHPDDHLLLGICWDSQVFVDRSLPFGLRSAPKIFTAFADMVAWVIHCQGVRRLLHYLDDFLLFGAPGSLEIEHAIAVASRVFSSTGIPVATHKTEGPATAVTLLGILVDTAAN